MHHVTNTGNWSINVSDNNPALIHIALLKSPECLILTWFSQQNSLPCFLIFIKRREKVGRVIRPYIVLEESSLKAKQTMNRTTSRRVDGTKLLRLANSLRLVGVRKGGRCGGSGGMEHATERHDEKRRRNVCVRVCVCVRRTEWKRRTRKEKIRVKFRHCEMTRVVFIAATLAETGLCPSPSLLPCIDKSVGRLLRLS